MKVVRVIKHVEYIMDGETEDLVKKEVSSNYSAFFCMSLYTSLYAAIPAFVSWLNFQHLSMKWLTSKE
jgi:hypothetical protein